MDVQTRRIYEFGHFRIDSANRRLLRDGEIVPLKSKVFDTLLVLMETGGETVTKDQLMQAIWPDTMVEENNLTQNIYALRKVLGERPGEHRYIVTVPGQGYRFVSSVRQASTGPPDLVIETHTRSRLIAEETSTQFEPEASPEPGPAPAVHQNWKRASSLTQRALWISALAIAAVLPGLYFLWDAMHPRPVKQGESLPTIAVLPFKTLGEAGDTEYLGLGMADALITKLSNVKQIIVRPTSAVRKYAGSDFGLGVVASELKVDSALEGTIQRSGEQIRVTVQLVNTRDGTSLWAGRFDEKFTDIFTVQDTIAEKVTSALKVQISAAERERVYRRYTSNAEAYDLYLRGRSQTLRYSRDGQLAALEAFESVLRLQPDYAPAHAGLASASAIMRMRYAPEGEAKYWGERAMREAKRALELDPDLAEAHESLAAVYRFSEFDWERTIEESHRTLELNPSLDTPHYYRAVAYEHLGLFDLAEQDARAGMEIAPEGKDRALRSRYMVAFYSGRYQEAVALLEELDLKREREPGRVNEDLVYAYFYAGERDQAEQLLANSRELEGQIKQLHHAMLASFIAARGDKARAAELLRGVVARPDEIFHHTAYSIGVTYGQLGRRADAIKWLIRAVESGYPCYPWYERDPLLDPLRGEPEFQLFMKNLRASWEATKMRYGQK